MKISVIIPSYKPSGYIGDCLASLCTQTLDKGLYEIVVVLNGCNEPYYGQLESFIAQKEDVNIRLIQTDTPGVSNARNIGIECAKGEYISFVDDDDWVTADYLEALVALADDGTIVASNVLAYDDVTGKPLDYFLTRAYDKNMARKDITFFSGRSFLSNACCKLIPRVVIGDDRFDTKYKLGEDSLFMFRISRNIKNMRLAGKDTVYSVRYRDNSSSHSSYTYFYRLRLSLSLTFSYFKIYLSDIRHYDFWLFVSRVVATLRKLFYRKYE